MRDYNYEAAAALGYEAAMANASLLLTTNDTLACPARSFNHSQHRHTFVTEVTWTVLLFLPLLTLHRPNTYYQKI